MMMMMMMEEEDPLLISSSSSSWTYEGEGGQHAVFADRDSGRLLRVDKAVLQGTVQNETSSSSSSLHSLLHPYVDVPERVFLDRNLLRSLRREMGLARGQRPPRRRRDWSFEDASDNSSGWGSRMPDYRLPGVCVEVKPKGGYITASPFLEESRRHKYYKSRYTLLQELYREGKVIRDWMMEEDSTPIQASAYDPVDLFSGDAARMRHALHQLVQCPQNNLQIWRGRHKVLGGKNNNDWRAVGEALGLPKDRDDDNVIIELLIELLVQVLLQEPFLSRVLALQKLDLLDTDGAILVFRRLIQLCDGDEKRAESLLEDFPLEWTQGDPITVPLLTSCPLPQPKETVHLAELCEQMAVVAIGLEHGTSPSLQNIREARQTLDSLSLHECRYLLQAWLISLTICDLTFFLHLEPRPANPDTEEHDDIQVLSLQQQPNVPDIQVLSLQQQPNVRDIQVLSLQQQPNVPGRISFPPAKTELQYMLKAIDLDRKPARKIRSRYAKESQFDR
jgi:hypothetical protein